jgi:hypothetical protein
MAGLTIPIDGVVEVRVTTRGTSGGLMDATGNVTLSVYEDSSTTEMGIGPINMTNWGTGKYRTTFTMSAANGFEATKMYTVQVNATVDGVTDAYDVLAIYCQSYALASALTTLSAIFSGITSLAHWLGLIAGKQAANATAQTEIRATGAGSGTYDPTTDSLEANRDNIGTAGANLTVAAVTGAVGSVTGAVGSVTGNVGGNVVGSVGSVTGLTASNLDATISSRATPAQVNTEVDTALSDVGVTLARMGALTDWIDGGRLDLLLDGVVADNPNRPTRGVQLDDVMFMMVDATDGKTPETGITVTATISKDGGAFATCTNAVSEVSGGFYKITLTATELTANSVALKMTGTGCAQTNIAFRTQPT